MKILIIEDEPSIRQTLQDLLELNHHNVLAAANGPEGVELVKHRPDIILCDVGMPGMNGYEVISAIQSDPQYRDIPFIFLTARAAREDHRRGMSLGADDYITKPFTEKDIVGAIAARIRRQQPLRERIEAMVEERRSEAGANWSHELMTPLNGIFGGLDLIEQLQGKLPAGEMQELLGLIRESAERQQNLFRKVVLFYELERRRLGQIKPPPESCDAETVVQAAATNAAQAAKRPGEVAVVCEPVEIGVNGRLLTSAVTEIVANALRFSPEGSPVKVVGTHEGTRYRLTITDRGIGMKPENCAKIGAFVQFERPQREQQGLGLGLAIARAVSELAGGTLHLSPNADGPGLRVTFDFPFEGSL
ncbi:MAG: response regulator [Verrucomicrobiota bacterium]